MGGGRMKKYILLVKGIVMSRFFYIILTIIISGCGNTENIGHAENTGKTDKAGKTDKSPFVSENFIEGASEVLKEDTTYYGVGHFVASPIKISKKGWIFDTYEAEVNMGAFGEKLIGSTTPVSIEEDDVAQEFETLDQDTLYVFKYEYPHKLNPEIEDTHLLIRSWEPLNTNISLEFSGVESYVEKSGSYSEGIRQGKVIQVERWGYWDIDCSVTILMGGVKQVEGTSMTMDWMSLLEGEFPFRFQSTEKTTENNIIMNTYSEEACVFAEKALKAGVNVSFLYSQDYIEWWDRYDRILHLITTLSPSDVKQILKRKKKNQ